MNKSVRTSAKAVVISRGRLLAIRNHSSGMDWFILPGGGQHHGESLTDALIRECMEEASLHVEPGRLLFVRDYISGNHEFADEDGDCHQVELMFLCTVRGNSEPALGPEPDQFQTGVQWLPLDHLGDYALYPSVLKELLAKGVPAASPVYLGDVN